jgi:hypothetical protein
MVVGVQEALEYLDKVMMAALVTQAGVQEAVEVHRLSVQQDLLPPMVVLEALAQLQLWLARPHQALTLLAHTLLAVVVEVQAQQAQERVDLAAAVRLLQLLQELLEPQIEVVAVVEL